MTILSIINQKKHAPSVLDAACQTRLGIMNDVARDLKKRGYTLGQQELYPVRWNSRPAIEIKRNSDAAIIDVICFAERSWFTDGRGYAIYRDVTVWWRAYE